MLRRYLHRVYHFWSGVTVRIQRRFTPAGFLVLGALIGVVAFGLDTLFSMTYQALAFLVGLLLVSWSWAGLARGDFSGRRRLPRYGTAGHPLAYQIQLRNDTRRAQRQLEVTEELEDPRPSFEEFRDVAEPGEAQRNRFDRLFGYYRWRWLMQRRQPGTIRSRPVPDLASGQEVVVTGELRPRRRGPLRLTGLTVSWPDPFGLCRAWRRLELVQSVLILPRRYRLPRLALPGTQQYQPGGVALARPIGESEEFVGVRDYRRGDPLRRVHWRSWAKAGRPIVREYQDEFFVRHALILDTFQARGEDDLFEEAVSVAASLACTVEEEDSLLDLLFVGTQAHCFTAGRGLAHPDQMLEILACVPACRDQPFLVLENLVLRHAPLVNGAVCVLLDWDPPRRRLVRRLQQIGIPVVVFVLHPAGSKPFDPPDEVAGGSWKGLFHCLEVGKVEEQLARL